MFIKGLPSFSDLYKEMKMIKGIVFDKDGTLMDYDSFWGPVGNGAIERLVISHGCDDRLKTALGLDDGINCVVCYGTYGDICDALNLEAVRIYGENSVPRFTLDEVISAFEDSSELGRIVPTVPNIKELMHELRDLGYKTALITSDNLPMAEKCLDALGILGEFDMILADDGVNPPKPDPYHMNEFLKEYSLLPSEVLMVGDTMTDMRFAERSGVHSMAVAKDISSDFAKGLKGVAEFLYTDIGHVLDALENLSDG